MKASLFLDICKENYLALMKMLENTIDLCPDNLWADKNLKPQYWQEVYHTIYYLEFYFGSNWKNKPERFELEENLGEVPITILSKEDLLIYLNEVKEKFLELISNLSAKDLKGKNSYFWTGTTLAHKLIYNIRHSQHHVGKINSILSSSGVDAADWVINAEKKGKKQKD